jgi:predicted SprT family Zn-dependent metalloprotease
MGSPTGQAYSELQQAFDHFNRELFGNELPHCLITLQREKSCYGYFSHERFVNGEGVRTDEIAMNPSYFAVVPVTEIMQTLVHEMTHLWQHRFGKPGRRRYHNREWAGKMESIGLMPSSTGQPGGKRVGEHMADYVLQGGAFEAACRELLTADFCITWKDRFPAKGQLQQIVAGAVEGLSTEALEAMGVEVEIVKGATTKSNRRKYSCPNCGINAWGKPNLNLRCGDCDEALADIGS